MHNRQDTIVAIGVDPPNRASNLRKILESLKENELLLFILDHLLDHLVLLFRIPSSCLGADEASYFLNKGDVGA